jgi:DNA-binding Xre family transcriptional regulator/DNA-binding transcriptional regulator YdaS (Cro superfamily)
MRWATGLKRALDSSETSMDVEQLAVLLEKDPETVHAWKDLHRQVDPKSQLLIAETLKMRPAELFDQVRPDQDWWAHGLRVGLQSSTSSIKTAQDLAAKIGSSPESIRRYMELSTPVPKSVRDEISKALDLTHSQLFTPNRPMVKDFLWAAGLRYAMQESEKYKRAAQLAEAIDADLFKVRSWMEMEVCEREDRPPYCGQVAPATRKRIALLLEVSGEKIFTTERAEREFLWAVTPDFQQAVETHGGSFEIAERIDVDQSRLQRWIDGAEPIAPATRARIKRELGIPLEDDSLFEWRQPGSEKAAPEEGVWWGAMLRDGLVKRGKRVADLAGEIGITEDALHGYIELEQPVPKPIRDKIARQLSLENDKLFSKGRPEPSQFRWAANLRNKMIEKGMADADLALAIDGDVRRIRIWMDIGPEVPVELWNDGKGKSVKLGQVAPATQKRLAEALDCEVNDLFNMFDTDPTKDTESRWAVQPSLRIAIDAFGGGRSEFLREAGIDEQTLARWLSWETKVREPIWRRINQLFGLPENSSVLFSADQKVVDAQG